MHYVYIITNLVNNKKYVGQTNNLLRRWKRHLSDAKGDSNLPIHRAISKYGLNNFKIEVIAQTSNSENINCLESICIDQYNTLNSESGYNLVSFDGKNKIISTETRLKMSEAQKGKKSHRYGKPLAEATKCKISKTLKRTHPGGVQHSEEFKERMRILNTGKKMSPEAIEKSCEKRRKLTIELIEQIKNDYEILKSSRKLAKKYNLGKTTILKALKKFN